MKIEHGNRIMIAIVIVEVVAVIIILAHLAQVCCTAPPAEPTLIALSIGATSSPTNVQKSVSQTPQILATQTTISPTEIVPTATPTLIPDTTTPSPTLVPPSPTATLVRPTEKPTTIEPTTAIPATAEPPTKAPPTTVPPTNVPPTNVPQVPVLIVLQPTVPIPTAIPTTAPSATKIPPTARPETATPLPPSATPTATATDDPIAHCSLSWAIHPLPDITDAAQIAINNAGLNTVTVTAEAFGEDCKDSKTGKLIVFGTMSTDFYLVAPISDFSDADAMAVLVKTAYQTLTTLNISLPALPGYLDIKFTAGGQTKEFRAQFQEVKAAIDAGKSSAELLAVGGL